MSSQLLVSIITVGAVYLLRTLYSFAYQTTRWSTLIELILFARFLGNAVGFPRSGASIRLRSTLPGLDTVLASAAVILPVAILLYQYPKGQEPPNVVPVEKKARRKSVRFAPGTKPASLPKAEQSSCDVEATFYPCKTTHSRFFPVKHSFVYNYLLVGLPVTDSGTLQSNSLFSILNPATNSHPWSLFSLHPKDYLARGNKTLKEKLATFLTDHELKIDDYQLIYLVTAPRFLGYSFNPVSFWYLYTFDEVRKSRILQVVILEVNNTFDERWLYILKRPADTPDNTDREIRYTFAINQIWKKELHVSPFNERDGGYTAYVRDPLTGDNPGVDMKIILHAPDLTVGKVAEAQLKTKLTARVWSTSLPKSISTFTYLRTMLFAVQFGYGCFLTFPKIVWEAAKLFTARRLNFFMRPEPVPGTAGVGRHDTSLERYFETLFRTYLEDISPKTMTPIKIQYHSSLPLSEEMPSKEQTYISEATKSCPEADWKAVSITVSSPRFYTRFFCFGNLKTAVEIECYLLDDKKKRVLVRDERVALDTLEDVSISFSPDLSFQDRVRWRFIPRLRKILLLNEFSEPAGLIPNERFLLADQILLNYHQQNPTFAKKYTRAVLKALLTEVYGFGDEAYLNGLLGLVWLSLVALNIWLCAGLSLNPHNTPMRNASHENRNKTVVILTDGGIYQHNPSHSMIRIWVVLVDVLALHGWWMVRSFLGV